MDTFKYRYLCIACLGFFAALELGYNATLAFRIVIAAICFAAPIVCFCAFLITRKKVFKNHFIKYAFLYIFIVIGVLVSIFVFDKNKEFGSLCDNNEHTLEFKVDYLRNETTFGYTYAVSVTEIDSEKKNINISLFSEQKLNDNEIVSATVTFTKSHHLSIEDCKGADIGADVIEITSRTQGKKDLKDHLRDVNKFFDSIMEEELSPDAYALMSAMFLGNRDNLDPALERDYARIGLVHILSLSGMHISIFITLVGMSVYSLSISKRLKMLIMTLTIFGFVAISGFQDTAIRSALMQIIFFSFHYVNERADSVTSLFVSVLVIYAFNPYLIFSLSLSLSFLAMLGCVCSSRFFVDNRRRITIRKKWRRVLVFTLFATLLVTFISLPLISMRFGTVSMLSFPSNVLIAPFLNVLIYLAPFLLIFSGVPFVSDVIAFVCNIITDGTNYVCTKVASLSWCCTSIFSFAQRLGVALLFIGVIILIGASRKRLRYVIYTCTLGMLIFLFATGAEHIARNYHYSVQVYTTNYGETVYIESGNRLIAIDSSSHALSALHFSKSIPSYGYMEIDSYVMCDYGYKCVDYIDLLTDRSIVRSVYLQKPTEDEEKYANAIVPLLEGKGIEVYYIEEHFSIDDVQITFCQNDYSGRSTKRAVVYSFVVGGNRFTYLGASSFEILDSFCIDYAYASDVLIFGSYGPTYEATFSYEAPSLDLCIMLGNSREYMSESFLDFCKEREIAQSSKITVKK